MEKTISSQEFNNILEKLDNKYKEMNININNIKSNIDKKLLVIEHESEYFNYYLSKLTMKQLESNKNDKAVYIMLNNNYNGLYESYSNLIHPALKKEPVNILNLKAINTGKIFFRDDVSVTINGTATDYFKNIIKDDSLTDKEIFFEEYPFKEQGKNDIKIAIESNSKISSSKFNMIEIDPFLYKSFNIKSIKVYTDDLEKPAYEMDKVNEVGKTRLFLNKKYDFKKVVFIIEPLYNTIKNNKKIIPFGLKHIYFYNVDLRNDSYVIIKYTSIDYIDNIKNDMVILTPFGSRHSTLEKEGIQIYLDNSNDVLSMEQEPSKNIKKPIARNINSIYFKIPLKCTDEQNNDISLLAFKFFIETR